MLKKKAFILVQNKLEQLLKSTFIAPEKSEGFHPVINPRRINSCLEYNNFVMERIFLLERTSRKRRLSLQADREGCFFFHYFFIRNLKVSMERKTVPISLSVFWALFSVKAFYKARESPNFNSKRLIILPILHLDGIFVIELSQEEIMVARSAFIFLLPNLGFSINVKESVLQSCQKIEFLGVIVESKELNLSPPQRKVSETIEQCQLFLARDQVSVREISQLIWRLYYSSIPVPPAPFSLLKGNKICLGKLQ